jgi:hypothetical protein
MSEFLVRRDTYVRCLSVSSSHGAMYAYICYLREGGLSIPDLNILFKDKPNIDRDIYEEVKEIAFQPI